ncbi:MAG: substrate-binding domain-containing protein [Gemmatimonadota bacterium]
MVPLTVHRSPLRVCASSLCLSLLFLSCQKAPQANEVVLATTTSTRDSGLLDSLVPAFESTSGYKVKVVAVGTGQAIVMARRGDAQVVLVHAPEIERAEVDSGNFVRRRLVMHNDFLFVGPASDPAGLRGLHDPVAALRRIAETRTPFISRGDRSGTHVFEQKLWRLASLAPPVPGGWYVEAGQGMAATLQMADEKHAYTITDRGTFLAWQSKLELVPLVEGDTLLYNVYHVMEVPNAAAGARALADFFVSAEAQGFIGRFGTTQFGRPLFIPDAGKPDTW